MEFYYLFLILLSNCPIKRVILYDGSLLHRRAHVLLKKILKIVDMVVEVSIAWNLVEK